MAVTGGMAVMLRAATVQDIAALQAWCLDQAAGLPHLTAINLAASPPRGLNLPSDSQDDRPPYDAVLQFSDAVDASGLQAMLPAGTICHVYRVRRSVIRDDGPIPRGWPAPGLKMMHALHFHADMPDSAVRRSWANHARLAVKVHIGAARYCQNWIEARLSDDGPAYRGMSELHFPSEQALIDGYFDSPRGGEEIAQDIAHFIVGRPPRIFTQEYTPGHRPAA